MSLHEDLVDAINQEIEAFGDAMAIQPTSIALAVQDKFAQGKLQPHIQYTSLEHLKHMARRVMAGRFEPDGEDNPVHQGELFSGTLQDRYPVPRQRGTEPTYKRREDLSDFELRWNVDQLRKSASARMKHADALLAWADSRSPQLKAA